MAFVILQSKNQLLQSNLLGLETAHFVKVIHFLHSIVLRCLLGFFQLFLFTSQYLSSAAVANDVVELGKDNRV